MGIENWEMSIGQICLPIVYPHHVRAERSRNMETRAALVSIASQDGKFASPRGAIHRRPNMLRVTSGHPLLTRAAMEAVKQWKYRPTLLNGEPVEVITTVTVTFTLQ
jgi:hypothetical protein